MTTHNPADRRPRGAVNFGFAAPLLLSLVLLPVTSSLGAVSFLALSLTSPGGLLLFWAMGPCSVSARRVSVSWAGWFALGDDLKLARHTPALG